VRNKKKMLLLVDDDPNQLAMRKTVLETSGYDVLAAEDAGRGLQLFLSHPPDAVILDYEMPVVNGEILAGRMRRADCSVPILMLSGCVAPPESAFRAVDTFVAKNNPAPVLLTAIETLMHSRELEAA
jgi:DNA-binding response OmpR family regulator